MHKIETTIGASNRWIAKKRQQVYKIYGVVGEGIGVGVGSRVWGLRFSRTHAAHNPLRWFAGSAAGLVS